MPALAPLPSLARVAANRRNAEKSTGPRTEAGKARLRGNARKHGLTGAGIALPGEDDALIRDRFAALRAELAPTTEEGEHQVGRMALAMVRIERAARHETASLAHRMRHAADDHDRARRDAARSALDRLADEPRAARRDLLRTPEGVDLLVDTLRDLRGCVARLDPVWSAEFETLLIDACGWEVDEFDPGRGLALSRAARGDDRLLDESDHVERAATSFPAYWAALNLVHLIDAEVARLAAHAATLDHARIALDRAEAADRALFDPGRDAQLARRYEAQATREFRQALGLLRAAEAEARTEEAGAAGTGEAPRPTGATPPADPAGPIEESGTVDRKSLSGDEMTRLVASFGTGAADAPHQDGLGRIVAEAPAEPRSIGRAESGNRPRLAQAPQTETQS